jgi:hypothetical protein
MTEVDDDNVINITVSPRYRYLAGLRQGSGGGGMDDEFPKAVTLESWEVRVVLTALEHNLRDTIASTDGRDDGLVEYIKILSGVTLKLEEANGGPLE